MKHLFLFFVVGSLFTTIAFAEETTTECLEMREDTLRSNPKANTTSVKTTTKEKSEGQAQ